MAELAAARAAGAWSENAGDRADNALRTPVQAVGGGVCALDATAVGAHEHVEVGAHILRPPLRRERRQSHKRGGGAWFALARAASWTAAWCSEVGRGGEAGRGAQRRTLARQSKHCLFSGFFVMARNFSLFLFSCICLFMVGPCLCPTHCPQSRGGGDSFRSRGIRRKSEKLSCPANPNDAREISPVKNRQLPLPTHTARSPRAPGPRKELLWLGTRQARASASQPCRAAGCSRTQCSPWSWEGPAPTMSP